MPSCVPSSALFQLDSGTCSNCMDCFIIRLCHLFKDAFQTVRMSIPSLIYTRTHTHNHARMHIVVICDGVRNGGIGAYLMYGNTSAGVAVGGVLLSGSFYMCPTVVQL